MITETSKLENIRSREPSFYWISHNYFTKRGASRHFACEAVAVLDDNYGVRSTIAEWSERRAGIGPFERSSVIYFEWRKLELADDAQFR